MRVVDGEHHEPFGRECPEQRQQRRPDQPPLGGPLARRLENGDLERVPLWRRQIFEVGWAELCQQVGQPGERERRLRLRRPRGEDAGAELARQADAFFPDGGLADPGLPDDRERGLGFGRPEELRDVGKLGLAPHERGHGQSVRRGQHARHRRPADADYTGRTGG